MPDAVPWNRAVVVGLGLAGEAVVRQVQARGGVVTVIDDQPTDATFARARALGIELVDPRTVDIDSLVRGVDLVLPGPSVPVSHPAIRAATRAGIAVWSEFELAARWDDRPIVAITGTNGKTTVTTLVTEILSAAGRKVVAAGNNDLPLVDALDLPDIELFVVEASSFRLEFTEQFRPAVAVWLNLSPDHLDVHPSIEHYGAAKARIWASQRDDDLAIVNVEDPGVMAWARSAPARVQTFGLRSGDYHVEEGALVAPGGDVIVRIDELPRRMPHDVANSLAASAAALAAGAATEHCRAALSRFGGLPHRVQLVGDAGGVQWFDDSKATTPASVVTAISGFDSAVLIAGGRNKGLDLHALREVAPTCAVVAIGEAGDVIAQVFAGAVPVVRAASMDEAVARAGERARPGDAVVLSPGCASYDWYRNYGERGDDFARAVAAHVRAST